MAGHTTAPMTHGVSPSRLGTEARRAEEVIGFVYRVQNRRWMWHEFAGDIDLYENVLHAA